MNQKFETVNTYEAWSEVAEQCVIGSIMINPALLADVCDLIVAASFHHADHRRYFQAITEVAEKGPVDIVVVVNHLQEFMTLQENDLFYLTEMAGNTPSSSNVMAYAKIIKEKSNERDVLMAFRIGRDALIDEDNQTSEERINNALAALNALDFTECKTETFNEGIKAIIEQIEERRAQDEDITGLKTGLAELDEATCGLQPNDLIILGARPSMGKTTLAMNIAIAAALSPAPGITMVFSMEMSQQQLQQRLIASVGGMNLRSIQRPKEIQDFEWPLLSLGIQKLKDAPIVIDDRTALSPAQVRGKCLREKRKHGNINLIVVDYLQLMTCPGEKGGRTIEIGRISAALKGLAKEFECPVLALSQLNRGLEQRADKRPIMADLRESGAIEQDADIIMFLYRDEVYNPDSLHAGFAELIIAKFRSGETQTLPLRTDLGRGRFRSMQGEQLPEMPQHENNKSGRSFNG